MKTFSVFFCSQNFFMFLVFNFFLFCKFLIQFFKLSRRKQQAVIEKFALCEENLTHLLKWISDIENKISSVGGPRERIDELRNQINLLKVSNSNVGPEVLKLFGPRHSKQLFS